MGNLRSRRTGLWANDVLSLMGTGGHDAVGWGNKPRVFKYTQSQSAAECQPRSSDPVYPLYSTDARSRQGKMIVQSKTLGSCRPRFRDYLYLYCLCNHRWVTKCFQASFASIVKWILHYPPRIIVRIKKNNLRNYFITCQACGKCSTNGRYRASMTLISKLT